MKKNKFNPVAKNAHLFNKSEVFIDKKKESKKGKIKHKGNKNEQ